MYSSASLPIPDYQTRLLYSFHVWLADSSMCVCSPASPAYSPASPASPQYNNPEYSPGAHTDLCHAVLSCCALLIGRAPAHIATRCTRQCSADARVVRLISELCAREGVAQQHNIVKVWKLYSFVFPFLRRRPKAPWRNARTVALSSTMLGGWRTTNSERPWRNACGQCCSAAQR